MPGPSPIHSDSPVYFDSKSGKRITESVLWVEREVRNAPKAGSFKPSLQPLPCETVVLEESIEGVEDTAELLVPITGEAPVYYYNDELEGFVYDPEITLYYEWWGEEVTVDDGMVRLAYVIGTKLIPLCIQLTQP